MGVRRKEMVVDAAGGRQAGGRGGRGDDGGAHHRGLRLQASGQSVRGHGVDQQGPDVISLKQKIREIGWCILCVCESECCASLLKGRNIQYSEQYEQLKFLIYHFPGVERNFQSINLRDSFNNLTQCNN